MSNAEIVKIERKTAPNEWDESVQVLIDAAVSEDGTIDSEVGIAIVIPAGQTRTGEDAQGAYDRKKFQNAANDKGYTARLAKLEKLDDGNYRATFGLSAKHAGRRGKSSGTVEESAAADAEATTE